MSDRKNCKFLFFFRSFLIKLYLVFTHIYKILHRVTLNRRLWRDNLCISRLSKTFNVGFFWATIKIKSFGLCWLLIFIKLYTFILVSVILLKFGSHGGIGKMKLNLFLTSSYPVEIKFSMLLT